MKKIVLTSLLAVFAAASANAADYFVGGAASLKLNDEHTNVMGIAPEVGWKYNDNWDFGIGAGFMYNGDLTSADLVDIDRYEYGVDLFARYKVAQWGNFKLLLKGTVGADFATYSSDMDAIDGETSIALGASIAPMVTYDVSEAFTLYANLNFMGISAGYTFENEDLNIDDGWNIGLFGDSANVLNTGSFQIGFLYNF
ncbi:MAG: outer membrane beta-barrel protein [Proteobacteria bacterium]|uniref:Outer membrane beta-barrel protein n=1 Tax=Candidatus Enterousia avistercoris TaxID=2840788 RepID=A0A9D9DFH2_9PROT|nr:outer membrane beta-barrel protein [Candidatus Enterousia avistercoris]